MLVLGGGTKNSGQMGPLPRAGERTRVSGDRPASLGNLVLQGKWTTPKPPFSHGNPKLSPGLPRPPSCPPRMPTYSVPPKGCPDPETALRDNKTPNPSPRIPRPPCFPQCCPDPHVCPASKPSRHPISPRTIQSPHDPSSTTQTPTLPPRCPRSTSPPCPSPCSQGGSGSGRWSYCRPLRGGRGNSAGTRAQSSQGGSSHCSRARPSQGGKRTPRASGGSWGCMLRTPVLPVRGTGCAGKGLCKQGSAKHLPQVRIEVFLVTQPTPVWVRVQGHRGGRRQGRVRLVQREMRMVGG